MLNLTSAWTKYFHRAAKKNARQEQSNSISYGEQIYSSPFVYQPSDNQLSKSRWLVQKYVKEFNVFCERWNGSFYNKTFVASFAQQQAAEKFALEMTLICGGKLNRKGHIHT